MYVHLFQTNPPWFLRVLNISSSSFMIASSAYGIIHRTCASVRCPVAVSSSTHSCCPSTDTIHQGPVNAPTRFGNSPRLCTAGNHHAFAPYQLWKRYFTRRGLRPLTVGTNVLDDVQNCSSSCACTSWPKKFRTRSGASPFTFHLSVAASASVTNVVVCSIPPMVWQGHA